MGLIDDPIPYIDGGYRFAFKTMTHEMLNNGYVSKGDDAMDYQSEEGYDDNQYSSNGWLDDDN